MPRRNWIAPMLTHLRGTDTRPISNGFESLTSYLGGHVGFWGFFSGTTDANGQLTIPHKCGFFPSAAFAQAIYDGSSPRNHYGPIHVEALDENDLTLHLLRANGNNDASSFRQVFYHILPKVNER